MGFSSLQHIQDPAIHLLRAFADARWGPSSGFGYPLDGFRPPNPRRPCFVPTALLGFSLRSIPLSEGTRRLSTRMNPLTVSPTVIPVARRRQAGPVGRGSWALTLPRVPRGRRGVSAIVRRILPWVFPLQGVDDAGIGRTFARPPLTRFAHDGSAMTRRAGASEFRSAIIATHPAPPRQAATDAWINPLGVSRAVSFLAIQTCATRAIFFTSHRVVHHCRPPVLFGWLPTSC
jgi:hypothetical protein